MIGAELIVYTDGYRITGTIDTGAQRLSDFLNDPQTRLLGLRQATYQELTTPGEPAPASRLTVPKEQAILIIPLDTPVAGARIRTQLMEVHLGCRLFSVVGNLHRRPADPMSLSALIAESTRAFIPISGATLRYLPNPELDADIPVVLVQARWVQFWAASRSAPTERLVF